MYKLEDGSELTEEIKNAFKRNTTKAYIKVNNTIIDQSNYLMNVKYKDEKADPQNGNFIGVTSMREINVKISNINNQFNLENSDIEYHLGALYNGEYKYINYGNFIVQKPENEEVNEETTFTALDYMCKFDTDDEYIPNVVFPTTLLGIAQDVCAQADVQLGNEDFRNANMQILANPFVNGENKRTVLKSIAKLAFACAYIGQDNKLYIGFDIKDTVDEAITVDDFIENKPNDEIKPITAITLRSSEIKAAGQTIYDEEHIAEYGTNELIIEEDYFAYTDELRLAYLQAARELFGLTYKPLSIDLLGSTYLSFNDVIEITSPQNQKYKTYALNNNHEYNGVLYNTISVPSLSASEEQYKYESDEDTSKRKTAVEIDKANQRIQLIETQIGDRSGKTSSITQEIDQINITIGDLEDLTLETSGLNPLALNNCLEGELINLRIIGNNTIFDGLKPSNSLVPSNSLKPHGSSILKIYTDNKCPTKEETWERQLYNYINEVESKNDLNRYLATWFYNEGGITKYRAGLTYNLNSRFYYMSCLPNTTYKLKLDESIQLFSFFVSSYNADMFEKLNELPTSKTLFSPIISSNAYYDGSWKYDYDKKEYEITTGENDYYLVINYDYRVKNNFAVYNLTEEPRYISIINKEPILINKNRTMYFKVNDTYKITDILYYDSDKKYLGNYEDFYEETISNSEIEAIYPNDAVYYKFKIQRIENDVAVEDKFKLEDIKPILSDSLENEYVDYNSYEINLGITEPLRQLNASVYDEFIYDSEYKYDFSSENQNNVKCKIIRRVGVAQDGTLYELVNPIEYPLDIPDIGLVNGKNYIDFKGDYVANIYARWVQITDFTKVFSTQYYVTSQILQLANSISLIVREKVGKDDIVAEINLAVENEQGIITIKGNQIEIKSDYFELTPTGKITATSGTIAGFNMWTDNNQSQLRSWLTKDFMYNNNKYRSGLLVMNEYNTDFLFAGMPITESGWNTSNAAMRLLNNGTIYCKEINMNGESGYVKINYNSGREAMNMTVKGIDWKIDNSSNNRFCYVGRSNYTMQLQLFDAECFNFADGVHNLVMGQWYKYNPNETEESLGKLGNWFTMQSDLAVAGYRHNGVNYTMYIHGYEVATNASDERLKENIKNSTDNALEKLNGIKIRQFDWRKDKHLKQGGQHINNGFIAQEVQKIDETLVNYNEEFDTYQMNNLNLIALNSKAIQELKTIIDKQQEEINYLKEEIKKLKGEI